MKPPLEGRRVVEIAGEIAGPYCTKLLTDLGADVIKVEPPSGDPLRSWGPFPGGTPHPDRSGLFEYINAGKQGATLDFTSQADLRIARNLLREADLLVESNPPGTLADCGLDRSDLEEINPRLVVARISNFGQAGPSRDLEAPPLIMQAASGWITTRDPDRPPVQAGARIPEYVAGAYAALAALTALRMQSAGSERVIEIDVSMHESLLSALPYPMLMLERMKSLGLPRGKGAAPILGVVPAADGWVGINCLTGQHWLDVCAMLELSEFREHQIPVMMGGPEREDFFARAREWLSKRSVEETVELCQAMRIPAAPVADGSSVLECPQYAARGFFETVQGDGWSFRRPAAPYRFSRTPAAPVRPAPLHGATLSSFPSRPGRVDPERADDSSSRSLPFAGLKVLDLSTFWSGAYLTCYLGAFGADVVKVESIQRPDGHRYSGAFPHEGDDWYERSALWQATNLNKRDLTLDLTSKRGLELARRLAADADVVVENFSPRVLEQFGLDYASLVELNPDVVLVRMPGFGLSGPWREYVGWALNFEQTSGMSSATGYPDGPPCNLQGPADPIVGVHAATALLAALEHRSRSGEGQQIEVAQIEVAACLTAEPAIEYSMNGVFRPREGNRQRGCAQGVYLTSEDDTWVAICVRDDSDWSHLVDAMDRPDLRDDPRFGSADGREAAHDAFDEVVGSWTRIHTPDEILAALRKRNAPAARLLTPDRMYEEEQLLARGYYEAHEHPITGVRRYPGWPFRMWPGPTHHHRCPPPTLGQHNREILRSLGLPEEEIETLCREEVIGERPRNA